MGRFAQTLLAIAGIAVATRAEAASDPRLLWKTIETRHFRVNYYSTEEPVAERVATLAESIFERLAPAVGWQPTEKTELAITDQTDAANGLASALPYNAIRLNVTAPDDMSPLGDYDDWYLELLTHEYTHILHTDHTQGIPALVNRVLGKVMAPNQVQPHWLLEGLAVYEESTRTSGGRLRSSMWNMFMRADVLENNVAPLDVFSNTPRRWPQGNIWYLYGSFFLRWIADTYGEDALRAMIDDQSYQPVPYGLNRLIRRATGRTFEELYPGWIATLRRDFEVQAAGVRARGLREGIRLTDRGNTVSRPRWVPSNAWPELQGDLTAYIDDGHDVAGLWGVKLERNATGAITGSRRRPRAPHPHERGHRRIVHARRNDGLRIKRNSQQSVSVRRPVRAAPTRDEPRGQRGAAHPMDRWSASCRPERVARRATGCLHDEPSGNHDADDCRPRRTFGACRGPCAQPRAPPRAKRALRSGVHAALVARRPPRRIQRVATWRVSRRSDRGHRRRVIRRRDA